MHLVDTNDVIDIALAGAVAANQAQFTADWSDITASGFTAGHSDGQTNGATVVTLVGAPGASTYRAVREITVYNRDTANVVVTIRFDNGTTQRELVVALLVPQNSLTWTSESGWKLAKSNAAADATPGIIRIATDEEMDAGTELTASLVTPGKAHLHRAMAKVWADVVGAGTGINASYNVSSIGDVGTGQLLIHYSRSMADSNHCGLVVAERGVTTYAVGDVEDNNFRFRYAGGGSMLLESYDHTATTMVSDDPASYYFVAFGDMVQ